MWNLEICMYSFALLKKSDHSPPLTGMERFSLSVVPCVSVYWQLRWEAGRGNGLICFLWLSNGKSPLRGSQLTDSNPSAQTSMRILLASSSTPPPNVVSPMRPKTCKGITEKKSITCCPGKFCFRMNRLNEDISQTCCAVFVLAAKADVLSVRQDFVFLI